MGILAELHEGRVAVLTIDHGLLCAQLGDLEGRDALEVMLSRREGSFEFEAWVEDGLVGGAGLRLEELLGDASPFVARS